jgi:uncharacterized protein YjiS (DUF1127 family)
MARAIQLAGRNQLRLRATEPAAATLELDGRLPADIGLSREDAVDEASKSSIRPHAWRVHQ